MEASANRPAPAGGLSYTGDPGTFDEVFTPDGNVRPLYAGLLAEKEAGRHGERAWMADPAARRAHPRARWAGGRAATVRRWWSGLEKGP